MIPIYKYINRLINSLLILVVSCSCSAQDISSPEQLIIGPFKISDVWKVIHLDQPLLTVPFVQTLDMLVDMDHYHLVETNETDTEYSITSERLMRLSDNYITQSNIILIDSKGRELPLTRRGSGVADTKKGLFRYLGHGTNSKAGKFLYPKGVKFTAIKIKSNIPITIEGFRWSVSRYYDPRKNWDNVNPSEIFTTN